MKDPARRFQYGQQEWNVHVFNLHNRLWAQDFSFPFDLLDSINRDTVCRKARIIVENKRGRGGGEPLDVADLEEGLHMVARGQSVWQVTKRYPRIGEVLRDVKAVGATVRGSPAERQASKKNQNGLQTTKGCPTRA